MNFISRLFPFVLAGVFSLRMVGDYFWFELLEDGNRQEVFEEMEHKFLEGNLEEFTFDAGAIEWMEKNEIRVNGKMIDVFSSQKVGDQIVIRGVSDEREMELESEFRNSFEKNEGTQNSGPNRGKKIAALKIILDNTKVNFHYKVESELYCIQHSPFNIQNSEQPNSPPPENQLT